MTVLLVLGAYLLGAVPFGLLVVRGVTGRDIRQEGSGNIGAANVHRIAGPAVAVLVLSLDLAKGLLPVLLTRVLAADRPGADALAVLAGVAAVAGHNWSIFLRGQGGKGIATSYGVLLALSPVAAAVAALVWVVVVLLTRYASLSSLLGVLSVPGVMLARHEPASNLFFGIVALIFGVYRHRSNIQRLLRGEERKLSLREREGGIRA